jgi:hypothetical protein
VAQLECALVRRPSGTPEWKRILRGARPRAGDSVRPDGASSAAFPCQEGCHTLGPSITSMSTVDGFRMRRARPRTRDDASAMADEES